MVWFLGIFITAIIGVAAWELGQLFFAQAPKTIKRIVIRPHTDGAEPQFTPIPRIIWSYWQDPQPPNFTSLCFNNWKNNIADHEIRILHKDNITDWIKAADLITSFNSLPAYRQADWLRVQLLARYGGIWMDATTILTTNLDWLHQLQLEEKSEYAGFYLERFSTNSSKPIIENWFMAATIESRFIRDLATEFDLALTMGETNYIQHIQETQKWEEIVQKIPPSDQAYLIMHIAIAVLLQRTTHYSLALLKAEDTAFAYHNALKWRKRHLFAKLAFTSNKHRQPALVKIRGCDRRAFEKGLAAKKISANSFIAKHLQP